MASSVLERRPSPRPVQKLFLFFAGGFLLFLVVSVVMRSGQRNSFLFDAGRKGGAYELRVGGEGGSEVRLQDFHRVEVKNGKPAWEVRAKEAQYYPEEGLTHVSDAAVTIYRARNSRVVLRSKAARLHLVGSALKKAEMEGDVVVTIDDSVFVVTDRATYEVDTGEVDATGDVAIHGPGFQVEGKGLIAHVGRQEIQLRENVRSHFATWAELPKRAEAALRG